LAINTGEQITVKHFFCDEMPAFKHNLEDSLGYCIEVECPKRKLVLSEIPSLDSVNPIFGYVEFTTDAFYEKSDRIKRVKSKMKIYFYARRLGFMKE
jgi:hypothetical protein